MFNHVALWTAKLNTLVEFCYDQMLARPENRAAYVLEIVSTDTVTSEHFVLKMILVQANKLCTLIGKA